MRDTLLKTVPKDIDIEVYGIPAEDLQRLVGESFAVNLVGKAFGVLKLKQYPIDISLPRRESKQGLGHRGFTIESDPFMTFAEASARRDFTLNALGWDPLTNELIDPWHGQSDLILKKLRHTSDAFSEDPLRVLRAMQFIARFDLDVVPETLHLCRSMSPESIAPERFFEEWKKWMLQGRALAKGLEFLRTSQWVSYYPELEALIGCEQEPAWHPEGDVWTHTSLCMDAFARERIGDTWEDLVVGFAVLCHDFGKPNTSFVDTDGRIRSPGHDHAGVPIAESFMLRITRHRELIDSVLPLVKEHMQALSLYKNQAGDAAVRRLATRIGRIDRLVRVDSADRGGRGDVYTEPSPQGAWLLKKAEVLAVKDQAPKPILQGRHLIALGLKPSKHFSEILKQAFEAQNEGLFEDETTALAYLAHELKNKQLH